MDEDFDLGDLVDLEQTFFDDGYASGFSHGRIHGLIEGRALGREKGYEIWEELGFYEGFALTWQAILKKQEKENERAMRHIKHLLELVSQFPRENPSAASSSSSAQAESTESEFDMSKLQRQIRSRYKALCASVGVRPSMRAAGIGPSNDSRANDDVDMEGEHETGQVRQLWKLDGDTRRPNVQDQTLSF